MPKDEFVAGYFAFFIPAIALIAGVWLFLRVGRSWRAVNAFLQKGSGLTAVIANPSAHLLLLFATQSPERSLLVAELGAITVLWVAYVSRKSLISDQIALSAFAVHWAFWFWELGPRFFFGGYAGPLASAVGLSATLAWFYYRKCALSQTAPLRR
jgi:hypothetical protein